MPGLTQRRSRRGSTFGLKLWKCMLGLSFVLSAPMAHSSEHVESTRTNNVHSRNATLSSSNPESTPSDPAALSSDSEDGYFNINNYCGRSWNDAYSNCPKACPSGKDSECSSLGEEHSCQSFTACHERIQSGAITLVTNPSGNGGETSTDPPSKQPTLALTAKPTESPLAIIPFPECPALEYSSSGSDYALGALVVYPIPGSTTNKEVYTCHGDHCNAGQSHAPGSENAHLSWTLVGTCSSSVIVASTEPTTGSDTTGSDTTEASSAARWWLENNGLTSECVYGEDYPEMYLTNEAVGEKFLFDSEEECCTSYPEACDPTNSTTSSSPLALTDNQPTKSPSTITGTSEPTAESSTITGTSEPTAAPSDGSATYMPTSMPTYNSAFIHGQNFLFGIATIVMALLF